MKINEVTEATRPGYADDPKMRMIANLGRKLMDMSAKMPMGKGVSDDDIAKSNRMSSFGDALTRFGTDFGPKNMAELIKTARVTPEEAKEFLAMAQKAPEPEIKGNDVEPEEPEADDEFDAPDDDAIAAKADRMARGK
jgi:Sec-independent protein translocase protein TatA